MTGLLTAITAYWNATSALVTSIGPLGLMESPPGTALTYVVLNPITAPKTWNYGSTSFAEPLIQFTVRGTTAAASLALAEAMCAILDDKVFTISGKQNFGFVRIGDPIPEPSDPEIDQSGNPSFGWVVQYSAANT
jgi:hypothetical protein